MPIKVTIEINDRTISTLHIARISSSSGRQADRTYEYAVLKQERLPQTDDEWMSGARFTHAYGDGAETCVRKAIEALESAENT